MAGKIYRRFFGTLLYQEHKHNKREIMTNKQGVCSILSGFTGLILTAFKELLVHRYSKVLNKLKRDLINKLYILGVIGRYSGNNVISGILASPYENTGDNEIPYIVHIFHHWKKGSLPVQG